MASSNTSDRKPKMSGDLRKRFFREDSANRTSTGEEAATGKDQLGTPRLSRASSSSPSSKWRDILSVCIQSRDGPNIGFVVCVAGCVCTLCIDRTLSVLLPFKYKELINCLTAVQNDEMDIPSPYSLLFWYLFILTIHGNGIIGSIQHGLWLRVSQRVTKSLQMMLFRKVMHQSFQWHLQKRTGEVTDVIKRGVNAMTSMASQVMFNLLPAIVDILVAAVYFSQAFDAWTGLVVLSSMVGYLLTVAWGKRKKEYRKKTHEAQSKINSTLLEALIHFETVQQNVAEEFELGRYADSIDEKHQAEQWANIAMSGTHFGQNLMKSTGLLVGSLLCVNHITTHRLTVGDFILFVTYLNRVYHPLATFSNYLKTLQQHLLDIEAMRELLREEVKVQDKPNAKDIVIQAGKVEFQNVSFGYVPGHLALDDVSFTCQPGSTTALVGHSGCGKTTLTRMLMRHFDPLSGTIVIDGDDIAEVSQKSLRKQIAAVSQDVALFNEDIHYNLSYSQRSASQEQIDRAARQAHIYERIQAFPDGYQTKVGERGLKVSGGERQRVMIARALLKDAPIFVLDEATSSLDTLTERAIQDTLEHDCSSKTTIIVAHRLSAITHADQILVFHHGRIVERGSHAELLAEGGYYHDLWQRQIRTPLLSANCNAKPLSDAVS